MGFEELASALDEGMANGVMADEAMTRGLELAVARTWLHLLGYLKDDNEKRTLDEPLRTGLTRFCIDAGIEPPEDGWSEHAMNTLKRLMSFEQATGGDATDSQSAPDRFTGFDLASPVMLRAITVRLYALDLTSKLPGKKPDRSKVEGGLEKLSRIYAVLQLGAVPAGLNGETIAALFDHKRVVRRLRQEKHVLTLAHTADSRVQTRRENKALAKSYVNAIGRIELWLIGYLSRPREKMWPRDTTNRSLPTAMRAFWRDQPEPDRPPRAQIENLDGFFFDRVQAVMESVSDDEPQQDEELQQKLLSDPELARKVKRETESLGARFIDGVRRVARFIIGWIRRGLGGLIALARNIAAVLASKVRGVFTAVRDVIFSIGESWKFLTRKPLPGSDPGHLLMFHDRDFDFQLVCHPLATPAKVLQTSRAVTTMAGLFLQTTRLVDELVTAFIHIARRAGIGGWFGALLALLSLRAMVAEMKEILRRIRESRLSIEVTG